MKLHMSFYLRAKHEVYSIILTSFRQRVIHTPAQNEPVYTHPGW